MFFPHQKVKSTQVINGLTCILSEEVLVNPNDFIARSGIKKNTMGIWDKDKRTFTKPNELHNVEAMESMFKGTGLMALDLYQDPQSDLKDKIGNFYEADLHKAYAWARGMDNETVTITSASYKK